MEIRKELMGFNTLKSAKDFNDRYEKLLPLLPRNEWVRCKDVDDYHYMRVSNLFRALCEIGLAKSRFVDDGLVEIPTEEWTRVDGNGQYETVVAYDKNGKLIGEVPNPQFHAYGSRGEFVKKIKVVHSTHTEYMYLGA